MDRNRESHRDMELKYTNAGMAIGNFSIAVNRRVKKGDEWKDEASFFDCTLFAKQAESLQKFLLKGTPVTISGELRQDRWEQDGQKRSKVFIAVEDVKLGSKREGGSYEPEQSSGANSNREFDDDIPF